MALGLLTASTLPAQDIIAAAIARLQELVTNVATRTLDILFGVLSRALYLVLAPFLAYYLLRDAEVVSRAVLSLIPLHFRDEALGLLSRLNRVGIGFIRGQIIVSAIVGLMVTIGLAVLGIKYAVLIGVVAGIFDVVPYFGPLIGGVPAVILGLLRSPSTAVWAAVWIFVVHQIEGVFLQPRIMGEHVGLHPLAIVFAILAGGDLFGIWGMLVAVPVAAVVKVCGSYLIEKLSTAAPGS
jgi:predicted PurR-regulated permease PerM